MKTIKPAKNSVFSLCRLFIMAVGIFVFSLVFSGPAFSYSEDTHFNMTYVICRSVGFSAQEALVIAAVDQGMDDSSDTVAHHGIIPRKEEEWRWHALDRGGKMHAAGIIARRDELFREALQEPDTYRKLIRLGVFFHYQQDSWAHRHHGRANHLSRDNYSPYKTPLGHGLQGHAPDTPPLDPVAALMCLEDGIVFARRFLKDGLRREPDPFLANYTPQGGSVDAGWPDQRKGKYFNQIDLSGAASNSARAYLLDLIRAQIDEYEKCTSIFPLYFLRRVPKTARACCVKSALEEVCQRYEPYRAVNNPDGHIVIPTKEQKEEPGFAGLTTAALLLHPLPNAAPFLPAEIKQPAVKPAPCDCR